MATGRIRRGAVRGLAALVLGWLAVLVGIVAFAPSASADPTATVYIRDLTPPLVSVDQGGTVTFVNQIQDKIVGVTAGLSLINATVHTDVTLALPSGKHTLQSQPVADAKPEPASSWKERFPQSCLTCTITYAYRVTVPDSSIVGSVLNTVVGQAAAKMPQSQVVNYDGQQTTVKIGVPTPFIVDTLVPLPNLPSVNLPKVPQVNVPLPGVSGSVPAPGVTLFKGGTSTITTTTTTTIQHGIDGSLYAYDTGNGAPQLQPQGAGAAAFDSSQVSGGDSSGRFLAGGAGGNAGTSDGASSPVYGLDGVQLRNDSATSAARQPALSLPALIAVVCLAGVVAALVRTAQARRAHR